MKWTAERLLDQAGVSVSEHRLGANYPSLAANTVQLNRAGELLEYTVGRGRMVTPSRRTLEEFIDLADAQADRVARFANRWGPLWLCAEHSLPAWHALTITEPTRPRFQAPVGFAMTVCPSAPRNNATEPVARWRRFSAQARAIVEIAILLRDGKTPGAECWEVFNLTDSPRTVRAAWSTVAMLVDTWMVIGRVLPHVALRAGGREAVGLDLGVSSLFGSIALQLFFVTSGIDDFAECDGCGEPYVPRRHPRTDQRRWCPTCREKGVPHQEAMRALRGRRKGTRR